MENKKNTPKTFTDHLGLLSKSFKEFCETSGIDFESFSKEDSIKESLEKTKDFLKGTVEEAVFFAIIFDFGIRDRKISFNLLSDFLKSDPYYIINYTSVFDTLKRKKLIISSRQWDELTYRIPDKILDSIVKGNNDFIINANKLDFFEFISEVSAIYDLKETEDLSDKDCDDRISYLISINPNLDICKKITDLNLSYVEKNILLHLLINTISDDGYLDISFYVGKVTRSVAERGKYRKLFHTGKTILQQKKFVRFEDIGPFHSDRHLTFTDEGIDYFIAEFTVKKASEFQPGSYFTHIKYSDIKQKTLFFDKDYENKMNELNMLLSAERYSSITNRLKEKHLSTGFTIMFYGHAGTGKTESVLQLANKTGRDVLMVNIESIRNKYVGDSEKRLAEVFKKYKEALSMFDKEPILLFNEADALIGKRINIRDSVDQMNNTMQNILLQKLEDFKGILVATTNLNENLDSAFERRFLYKMKFEKPTENVLSKIWKNHLTHISDVECMKLAKLYPFSGGQVNNIIRKTELHYMLNGELPDYNQITIFCEEENFSNMNAKNSIGFRKNIY